MAKTTLPRLTNLLNLALSGILAASGQLEIQGLPFESLTNNSPKGDQTKTVKGSIRFGHPWNLLGNNLLGKRRWLLQVPGRL